MSTTRDPLRHFATGGVGAWLRTRRLPVVVDLVWEEHRSPVIAAITVLHLLGFVYVTLVLKSYVDSSRFCSDVVGAPLPPAATACVTVVQAALLVTAALAACKANSFAWVHAALAAGFAHLLLMGAVEYPHCTALMLHGVAEADAIGVVMTSTVDLAFTVVTVAALLLIELDAWRRGATAGAPVAQALADDDDSAASGGGGAAGAPPPAAIAALAAVLHGARVAPLRHHIAAALACTFCLAATVLLGVTGARAADAINTDWWGAYVGEYNQLVAAYDASPLPPGSPLADLLPIFLATAGRLLAAYGAPAAAAAAQLLRAAVVGAALSCVVVVASTAYSYAVIGEDYAVLDALLARRAAVAAAVPTSALPLPPQPSEPSPQPGDAEAGGGASPAPAAFEAAVGGGRDGGDGRPAASTPAASLQLPQSPQPLHPAVGLFVRPPLVLACGAPDIASPRVSYFSAFSYASLYAVNLVTVWLLLACVGTAVVFAFISDALAAWVTWTVALGVLTWLGNAAIAAAFARCVASGNHVLHPRLLLLLDLGFSVSLGAVAGLTAGLARFFVGLLWLICRMTLLARPLVPPAAAGLDAGFVAHAGMLKAAFAWRLDPHSRPTEHSG